MQNLNKGSRKMSNFNIEYTGHEKEARELLVDKNITTVQKIAYMTSKEIEDLINENFVCYECGMDWLIIPKEKEKEFNKMINWICR